MSYGIRDARQLYAVDRWGGGYFDINGRGHLTAHPTGAAKGLDLYDLVPRLRRKKLRFPLLLRFPQVLEGRVAEIFGAFDRAIREYEYENVYRGVFPIKVNQHAGVVESLVRSGRSFGLGLEAGSKAELAVALSHELHPDAAIVCNGYKDPAYVRLALRGQSLGRQVFIIVEKPDEIDLIMESAKAMGVEPVIGMRVRLKARSSGKWERSSGAGAKFGLSTQELLDAVAKLQAADMLSSFQMLHFHAGSQITEIKRVKDAVKEGARIYAKLCASGCALGWLDVGGGLGVDYDGSKTSYEASMNYTVTEYANDVVSLVRDICKEEGAPPPILVSESGRAITAYHALLISEVRASNQDENGDAIALPDDAHASLRELYEIWRGMTRKNHREYFHDVEEMREELQRLFDLGYLSLRDRALGERIIKRASREALRHAAHDRHLPDEFVQLRKKLVTKYIANFSVFQSIPDSWALDQLFPVVPLHRLNQRPTVPVTLCDVTCDSDGEIDRFIDPRDVAEHVDLHELRPGEPYYVAIALIGAYQDVLGDYHNLFGRVDEATVVMTRSGTPRIVEARRGDEPHDVLSLFDHDPEAMVARFRERVAAVVAAKKLSKAKGTAAIREFEASLKGSTYLDFGG